MNNLVVPKFSEIPLDFIKDYLRVDYTDDDLEITMYIESAKEIVINDTGLSIEMLDTKAISTLAVCKLVGSMYSNKSADVGSGVKADNTYYNMIRNIKVLL